MDSSANLLRRYAVFPLIVVITTVITVFRDILYIPWLGLLVSVELLRLGILLVIVQAVTRIARHQNLDKARTPTWLAITGVALLDLIIVFAYPPDQIETTFLNLLFLLAVYFIPTIDFKAKRILLPAYSVVYIVAFCVKNESTPMTKIIVLMVYICMNLLGTFISKEAFAENPNPAQPAQEAAIPPPPTADIHLRIRERVDALKLTEREKEVAYHILLGETRTEIADDIYVTDETVKKHIANIYAKLGVSSKSEFFKVAMGD